MIALILFILTAPLPWLSLLGGLIVLALIGTIIALLARGRSAQRAAAGSSAAAKPIAPDAPPAAVAMLPTAAALAAILDTPAPRAAVAETPPAPAATGASIPTSTPTLTTAPVATLVAEAPDAPSPTAAATPAPDAPDAPDSPGPIGPRIFVSHSTSDNEFGLRLADDLRAALGADESSVWYDAAGGLQAGDVWLEQIAAELSDRDVFVLILSPAALASPWVQDELRMAWKQKNAADSGGKTIIPVLYQPCAVPEYLATIQYVSFLAPRPYEEAVAEVVTASRTGKTREVSLDRRAITLLGPPDDVALLPVPTRFVGRADDLEWVTTRLRAGGASAITALRGLGGIGKSTLAAEAVREVQREGRFPDGVAVVLCQGITDPADVLRRTLIRFDPYRRAPDATELPQLQETAQATLRGKRALIVLDNIEPELPVTGVVAPLRAAGLTALLTARQTLPGAVASAEATRSLDLLRPDEALDLFVSAAGRGSASALSPADRAAAERIVAALGQHTLAVKLAGAYAAAEQRDMGSLAQEFAAPAQGLALPGDDETPEAVRRTLALSLETLPLEAQRLFTALAAFATPEFGRQATLALGTALGLPQPNRTLHLLLVRALADPATNEALPAESDRERLRLHTLLRALAVDLFGKWPTADQDAASLAVAQTLAAYAEAHQTALVALGADEGNLSGALEWANAHDDPMLVAQLAHGMRTFWDMLGRLREGVRYLAWGVAAAEATQLHDTSPETRKQRAELDLVYGKILGYSGQYEDGEAVVQRSLAAFRAAQERRGEGAALSALGETAVYRGQYEAADDYLQQSLAIRREFFDRQGEGVDLGHLGSLARLRGQFELAEQYLEQALAISREVGDRFGEATAVAYLGQVTVYRRQFDVAERYLEQALIIDREVGDRQGEGVDLRMLGQIAIYRRQPEVAERYLEQALAISREVGDRLNEAAPQCLMGQVALLRQQFGVAQDYEEQAVAISRETGDRRWEAKSLCVIGRVAEAQTDLVRAETFYRQSLAFATELDLGPEIADAQLALGRLLAERLERRDEGCPLLLEAARRYAEMGMPEAEEARAVIAQVGCAAEE